MKNYHDDIETPPLRESFYGHLGAVLVGLCIGAIATYAMISPSVDRMKKTLDSAEQNLVAEQQARLAMVMKCGPQQSSADQFRIQELTEELAQADKNLVAEGQQLAESRAAVSRDAENANIATVLYEPAPSTASVTLTVAGRAVALPGVKKMQPRWYVPGKVTPIVYGSPDVENQFIWVDAAGHHAGPFPARTY